MSSTHSSRFELILDKIQFILDVEHVAVGVDQIEPLLADLLESIRQESACRDLVSLRFQELLDTMQPGVVELIQYCMHELRWSDVRERAVRNYEETDDLVRRRSYQRIIESFDDSWNERDLYLRYGREES